VIDLHFNAIDISGKRFGRLKVIEYAGTSAWLCKCDCGKEKIMRSYSLRKMGIISCGCYSAELARKRKFIHGYQGTPEFRAWCAMKSRCTNSNLPKWERYGGRGIKVAKEWQTDFMAFYNHIGKRPSPTHSLDRINNDGNYEPGNVRWATKSEQAFNRCRYSPERNEKHRQLMLKTGKERAKKAWATRRMAKLW